MNRDVWTGCRSQVRRYCRKSLICIRPVDRRVGRGLDGNTHAPFDLISGQAVEQPVGSPDSGCVYRSVPCSSSIANSVEMAAVRSPRPRYWYRSLVAALHARGDAGELVGQCDRELVPVQPLRRRVEPRAETISGPVVRAHQENLCCLDQQRAQILATALVDLAEYRPTTGAVFVAARGRARRRRRARG